jgi:hypothetical protein
MAQERITNNGPDRKDRSETFGLNDLLVLIWPRIYLNLTC